MLRDDGLLKIGAVAKAAGVGVQTLHYYERLRLLPKPPRSAANYRLYSPQAVRRVRFIKKAQALGLTLDETKQILDLKDHGRAPCRKVAELGEKHLRDIQARLRQLREYRRALAQAVNAWREENAPELRRAIARCGRPGQLVARERRAGGGESAGEPCQTGGPRLQNFLVE